MLEDKFIALKSQDLDIQMFSMFEHLSNQVATEKRNVIKIMEEIERVIRGINNNSSQHRQQMTFLHTQIGDMPPVKEVPALQIWPSILGLFKMQSSTEANLENFSKDLHQAKVTVALLNKRVQMQATLEIEENKCRRKAVVEQ